MGSAGVQVRLAAASDSATAVDVGDDPAEIRTAAATLARELPAGRSRLDATGLAGERLTAFVEGLLLGSYRFTRATSPEPRVELIELCGASDAEALERGRRAAGATVWARDLANTRSGEKTPAWLAGQAARTLGPLGVEVLERDESWLREQGFGGVLAVGGGSSSPPRLIEARWRPQPARPGRPRRARRQGHHLRHRRNQPQDRRRHGPDAHRHVRRRRGARRRCRRSRRRRCRCTSPRWCRAPRTRSPARPTARATSSGTSAGAPARSATPTPRGGSCWPTRSPTRPRGCGPPRSSTSRP